jgi:hypothetical protein
MWKDYEEGWVFLGVTVASPPGELAGGKCRGSAQKTLQPNGMLRASDQDQSEPS